MNIWSIPINIALSIPIFPIGSSNLNSIRVSRRRPGALFISPRDIVMNISDKYFSFIHKTPRDGQIVRGSDGTYQAALYEKIRKP